MFRLKIPVKLQNNQIIKKKQKKANSRVSMTFILIIACNLYERNHF
jgi:hypothetical protein